MTTNVLDADNIPMVQESETVSDKLHTGGKTVIANNVLAVIAGIATKKVEGVVCTQGDLASKITESFGKKDHGRGIRLEAVDDEVILDIHVKAKYGYPLQKIARNIKEKVKSEIESMTGMQCIAVNVLIQEIELAPEAL